MAPDELRAYAAERWARVVAAVVDSPEDPRTLEAWARVAAAGRGTLRSWCRGAGVSAKASLDFARLLRAVVRSRDAAWDPQNTLDIVDERTLKRLFLRGGLLDLKRRAPAPSWESFVAGQRLVSDELALRAIASLVPSTAAASRPRPLAR
jgi:hypothetical protein